MTTVRARMLLLIVFCSAVAACTAADATTPSSRLTPAVASHDPLSDSVPDAGCRSGFSNPNGRCTGE